MKPIPFKEANTRLTGVDSPTWDVSPGYVSAPVLEIESPHGDIVSCWHLSFVERLRLLLTGKVWVCLRSYNKPLPPHYLTTKKAELISLVPVDTKAKLN